MNWLEVYKINKIGDNVCRSQNNIMSIVDNLFSQKKLVSKKDIYTYRNLQLDVSNQNLSCGIINKTIFSQTNHSLVLKCTSNKLSNHQFPYISNYDQELTEYVNEYYDNKSGITIYIVTEINEKNKQKVQYIRLYDTNRINELLSLI